MRKEKAAPKGGFIFFDIWVEAYGIFAKPRHLNHVTGLVKNASRHVGM